MTDDFTMYQGDDEFPYFAITDTEDNPIDLSSWTAATWVAVPVGSTTPAITKHQSDMTLGVDPTNQSATVENCIFVHILPSDTGTTSGVGQFDHELRITIGGSQVVVYPTVGTRATFSVIASLSWNPGATPPAPRIEATKAEPPRVDTRKKAPSYRQYHSGG